MLSALNPKVLILLSEMIHMIPPGNSSYSRVMIPYCNQECQESKICEKPTIECKTPKYEEWYFEEMKENLGEHYNPNMDEMLKNQSFSRTETYEEGLIRYLTIAQAAYEVSIEKTMNSDERKFYYKKCGKWSNSKICSNLREQKPWKWAGDELAFALLTLAKHESSFRRDVHSGEGKLSMGDCIYMKNGQRTHKNDPEAERVCRSACLNQMKFFVNEETGELGTKFGTTQEDIVGIDLNSTKACFSLSADLFSKHRGWCSLKISGDNNTDWALQAFTAYGTGSTCVSYQPRPKRETEPSTELVKLTKFERELNPKFTVRSNTFWTAFNHRRPLRNKHKVTLEKITNNYTQFDIPNWLENKLAGN